MTLRPLARHDHAPLLPGSELSAAELAARHAMLGRDKQEAYGRLCQEFVFAHEVRRGAGTRGAYGIGAGICGGCVTQRSGHTPTLVHIASHVWAYA
jgi:hypothetical protein